MRPGTCSQYILKFVQEGNIHKNVKGKIKSNRISRQGIETASDTGFGRKEDITMRLTVKFMFH